MVEDTCMQLEEEKSGSDEKNFAKEQNGVHNCSHEQNRIGLNSEIQQRVRQ